MKLAAQSIERCALLSHVVVTVVVPRLHAGQAMRLKVTPHFSTDSMGCKKGLDTGANVLQLEAIDRVADYITRFEPRSRSHSTSSETPPIAVAFCFSGYPFMPALPPFPKSNSRVHLRGRWQLRMSGVCA